MCGPESEPPILTSTILGHHALFNILVAVLAFTLEAAGYMHAFTPKHQQLPSKQSCPRAEEPAGLASWKRQREKGTTSSCVNRKKQQQTHLNSEPLSVPRVLPREAAATVPSQAWYYPTQTLPLEIVLTQTLLSSFQKPSG